MDNTEHIVALEKLLAVAEEGVLATEASLKDLKEMVISLRIKIVEAHANEIGVFAGRKYPIPVSVREHLLGVYENDAANGLEMSIDSFGTYTFCVSINETVYEIPLWYLHVIAHKA